MLSGIGPDLHFLRKIALSPALPKGSVPYKVEYLQDNSKMAKFPEFGAFQIEHCL